MSGDLGNLLTGEMGEAEARFSHETFAADFGHRIVRRVRRRRAVRAAGVGGGTMLTAGALVAGVTQVPWGTLGATPGVGASDCVTTAPSDGSYVYEVVVIPGDTPAATVSLIDGATGAAIFTAVAQTDGSYIFTDAEGHSLPSTSEGDRSYRVITSQTPPASAGLPTKDAGGAEIMIQSVATATFAYASGATPSPSDDCYTARPAPSVNPTLTIDTDLFYSTDPTDPTDPTVAAKPEDFEGSPFECGFEFPTESYGTDALSIDGAEWLTLEDVDAQDPETAGRKLSEGSANPDELVPRVTVHLDMPTFAEGENSTGVVDTGEPSLEKISENPAHASSIYHYSKGRTFVGVRDGRVVATGTRTGDDPTAVDAIVTARDGFASFQRELMYLIDPAAALHSCDAEPVDLANVDIVAVAGLLVQNEDGTANPTVYAWLPVGKP